MPNLDSYLKVYTWHRLDEERLYLGIADPTASVRAFEQLAALASHECAFNRALPTEFIEPLRRYHRGDAPTLELFEDQDRRAFFLSDLLDYLVLFERPQVRH